MGWEEDHASRVARFPPAIRDAHRHSSNHRDEIASSTICGCFYCRSTFTPQAVTEWVDEGPDDCGQTALCPRCGVDSVIGDRSGFPVTDEFLAAMNAHWF
jgi:hypothetical protein